MNAEQLEKLNKDPDIGMLAVNDATNIFYTYYKTKTIRPIQYGSYYLELEDGSFELQPPLVIPELTLVILTKGKHYPSRKTEWLVRPDMDLKAPHPIAGVKLVYNDTEVLQRSIFIKKKWIES